MIYRDSKVVEEKRSLNWEEVTMRKNFSDSMD